MSPSIDGGLLALLLLILLSLCGILAFCLYRRKLKEGHMFRSRLGGDKACILEASRGGRVDLSKPDQCMSKPVKLYQFEDYLENILRNDHLAQQFQAVQGDSAVSSHGNDEASSEKCFINGFETTDAYLSIRISDYSMPENIWKIIWTKNMSTMKFWPDSDSTLKFGDFSIEFKGVTDSVNYQYARYEMQYNNKLRQIVRYGFERCHLEQAGVLLERLIKICLSSASPILLIHRGKPSEIGYFILSDWSLRSSTKCGFIDVYKNFHQLHHQHPGLIKDVESYRKAHSAILEFLIVNSDRISCSELRSGIDNIVTNDFIRLQVRCLMHLVQREANSAVEYEELDDEVFASSKLKTVYVDTLNTPRKYLVLDYPRKNTLDNFWLLLFESDATSVVILNQRKNYQIFIPGQEDAIVTGIGEIRPRHVQTRTFKNYKIVTLDMILIEAKRTKLMDLIYFLDWPKKELVPKDVNNFLQFHENVSSFCKDSHPSIIMCKNGTDASGLYVALTVLIEIIRSEQICDVFRAMQIVRKNCKEFLLREEQLLFLYDAAATYSINFL